MALSITVGEGKNRPQGKLLQLESPTVEALAQALEEQPSRFERWWSTHTWERAYRNGAKWLASCGVGVDLDHHGDAGEHCPPPLELARALEELAVAGGLPGNLFHATPRGARVVFVFPDGARDRDQFQAACRAASAQIASALAERELFAFQVDQSALEDLARLLFTPRAVVHGVTREAQVVLMRSESYAVAELAAAAPPPTPVEPATRAAAPRKPRTAKHAVSLDEAIARFNADHPIDAPRSDGDCPMCGHRGCFGRFPDDLERWACFSTNHDQIGVRGSKCWHGDALDLAAHAAGVERVAVLRREGYLPDRPPSARAPQPPPPDAPPNWVEEEIAARESSGELGQAAREPGSDDGTADATARVLTLPRDLPVLRLSHEEHELNTAAIQAVVSHPNVFQRGGALVRVARSASAARGLTRPPQTPSIAPIPLAVLRSYLTEVARFERWMKTEDRYVPDHPWDWLVRAVHGFGDWPGVRPIEFVTEAPVLRPDGSLVDQPGYDAATGVLYEPNCGVPLVPARPTRDHAIGAVSELLDLVCDFPFASDAHRAAWVAGLLTPLAKLAISSPSPLFMVDANVRGSGKSLLVDVISVLLSGRKAARMFYTPNNDEMKKQVMATALSGDRMVLFDNITGDFGGPVLDGALTSTEIKGRLLGTPDDVRVPLEATWYVTGNNLQLLGDMARRTLSSRLESPEEKPEERAVFKHAALLEHAARERPRYLGAALTILRAFCEAGRPSQKLTPWGSFESWSDLVREAVVWAGMSDPGETRAALAASSDVEGGGLAALLAGWKDLDPRGDGVTAADALDLLRGDATGAGRGEHQERFRTLRSALLELKPGPGGDLPSPRSLGKLLAKFRGRVVGGQRFESRIYLGLTKWFIASGSASGGFGGFGGSVPSSSQQASLEFHSSSGLEIPPNHTKPTNEDVF
jgi:hypothetical protein